MRSRLGSEEFYTGGARIPAARNYTPETLELLRNSTANNLAIQRQQGDIQADAARERGQALIGAIKEVPKMREQNRENQRKQEENERQNRKLLAEEAIARDQAGIRKKQGEQLDLETAAKRAEMDFANQEVAPGVTRRQREADLKDQEAALNRKKIEAEIGQINAKAKEAQQGKPVEAPKEWQFTAAGFGNNMENAETELSALEAQGFDRADPWSALQATTPDSFGAYGKSPAVQQYERAQRAFINSLLRDESGANISPQEYETKKAELFPVAGDSPETKAAKKRARMLAVAARKAEAGSAYDMIKAQMAAGGVKGAPGVGGAPARTPVKRQRNPSTGEIRIVYNDGSTEVVK